ncbi:hypothetical protein LTR64_008175 [Lithohypha guttulata]|uniref:uncharacterized protein n=1 Tax=Lithohypha guttulata TaxID=1690604 RepID=UPI002DDE36DF|nr:hypothetical protein LTR51_008327 [Lithohypha guttulata]
MQSFLGVIAGTTSLLLCQKTQRWREMRELVERLADTRTKLQAAEKRLTLTATTLGDHKKRVLHATTKTQEMIDYCEAPDAEPEDRKNIPVLQTRLQCLHLTSDTVDTTIGTSRKARDDLLKEVDDLVDQIIQQAHHGPWQKCTSAKLETSSLFTEKMLTSEQLDLIEQECAGLEEMLTEEPEHDENITAVADVGWYDQTTNLMEDFSTLKIQKTDLEKSPDTAAKRTEVDSLTEQILLLGEELTLRGVPIRNGSVIWADDPLDIAVDEDSDYAPAEKSTHLDQKNVQTEQISVQAVVGTASQNVFDWTHFQAPEQRDYGYDRNIEYATQEELVRHQQQADLEYQDFVDKVNKRVLSWLEELVSDSQADMSGAESEEYNLAAGLQALCDIGVGECFDVEGETSEKISQNKADLRRLQVETILRRGRREFCWGVQAELKRNRSAAIPDHWSEYLENKHDV